MHTDKNINHFKQNLLIMETIEQRIERLRQELETAEVEQMICHDKGAEDCQNGELDESYIEAFPEMAECYIKGWWEAYDKGLYKEK